MDNSQHKPQLHHSLLEARALIEALSLTIYWPFSVKKPQGDGQPVMVLPGFMTSDNATFFLRRFLKRHGYEALPWQQGRNPGLRDDIFQNLLNDIDHYHQQYGQKISLIGWSLGGLYARAIAHKRPDKIQQVITLGSPFTIDTNLADSDINISENVLRLYKLLNPNAEEDSFANGEAFWQKAPKVASTAIYSLSDGVANWQYCIDERDDNTENIGIVASHLGLTHNPLVYHLLLDRLQQSNIGFKRYQPSWLKRHIFSTAH